MFMKLMLLRMCPMIFLGFCKERKPIKIVVVLMTLFFGTGLLVACWEIFKNVGWRVFFLLPVAMFPHYLFYGFAGCILFRCILNVWSKRVWNRIYRLSLFLVFCGVLAENKLNPRILQFFFEKFK